MKGSRLLGWSIFMLLGLAAPLRTATATLSPLASAGETVVFSDDFDNGNSNGWSNIGTSSGQATIGTDPGGTGATVWYPTNMDGVGTGSAITFTNAIQLNATQPQINLYMHVRYLYAGDYFWIDLGSDSGNSYLAELQVSPASSTISAKITSRVPESYTGQYATGNTGFTTTNFMDYRLQLDFVPASGGNPDSMNLTASYYNGLSYVDLATQTYAKLVQGTSDGQFKFLQIYNRNGATTSDKRAYFDSVIISAVPEPATVCLLGSAVAGLLLRRRRQEA